MAKQDKGNWKKRLGTVYSTDPDFEFDYDGGQEQQAPEPDQQVLRVSLDRRNRKGKAVTLVSGFEGNEKDLNQLGKMLKQKCGVGGSVKDGEILVQGDHRDKVVKILLDAGYAKTKRSGG